MMVDPKEKKHAEGKADPDGARTDRAHGPEKLSKGEPERQEKEDGSKALALEEQGTTNDRDCEYENEGGFGKDDPEDEAEGGEAQVAAPLAALLIGNGLNLGWFSRGILDLGLHG